MESKRKTRLLILSDTHGHSFNQSNKPNMDADVAIHCGDLTDGSSLAEMRTSIQLSRDLDAPLKLAIAGNHDFTMDIHAFERKVAEATPPLELELVAKEYGTHGEARRLFDEAADAGIVFLDEGIHRFLLENGAILTVYASPFTPALGAWGFQYHPENGHHFSIKSGVDIAVTHGPPKGVMDYTYGRERAGCPDLFSAVAHARPRVHCFGHIHEGWGAKLVTWKDDGDVQPSHFTSIDNSRSHVIEKLSGLDPSAFDTEEDLELRKKKLARYGQEKCCITSHCTGGEHPIDYGEQTLFINASIQGADGLLSQKPWVVDLELPKAH